MAKRSKTVHEFNPKIDAIKAECTIPRNEPGSMAFDFGEVQPRIAPGAERARRCGAGAAFAPINNMGVTGGAEAGEVFDDGTEILEVRAKGSRAQFVRIPKPNSTVSSRAGFVDQVSFTLKKSEVSGPWLSDADCVACLSETLVSVFGFGVVSQRAAGLNFYQETWVLGMDWGFVSIGGQNETVLVQVTGSGCLRAKPGWEKRLHFFLVGLQTARITRVDLAADLFDGSYSPEQARADYLDGGYSLTARRPRCEMKGDWLGETDPRGRTFYVGSRLSGKLSRVYQKGLQLGRGFLGDRFEELAAWTRIECEWHNQAREIPLDVLLEPGKYLAGAYPCFGFLSAVQARIQTLKKTVSLTVEAGIAIVRRQFGRWFYALRELKGDAVLDEICIPELPKSLDFGDYRTCLDAITPNFMRLPDGAVVSSLAAYG